VRSPAGLASRLSLRLRLTFLATVAAAVVLSVGAVLLYGRLRAALGDALTAELRVRADDVAAQIEAGTEPVLGQGLPTQVVTGDGTVVIPRDEEPLATTAELAQAGPELVVDRAVATTGGRARLLVRRLPTGDGRFVAVAVSIAPIERAERSLALVLGIAGPAMLAVVAAMAWLLTGAALRPVARMTQRAATISLRDPSRSLRDPSRSLRDPSRSLRDPSRPRRDPSRRNPDAPAGPDDRLPEPVGRDEIAQLGRTLNAMLERIAATLAHERAFVDDASHELRTPLAVLRGELELARLEGGGDPATAAALDSALEEADRVVALTERLLVLARADAGGPGEAGEPVALAEVLAPVVARVGGGPVVVDLDVGVAAVHADAQALEQVFTNLVANALGWARTRVALRARTEGSTVVVTVADDGPGFDPAVLDRAFDRFSRAGTARSRPGGAGLGLAIVAALVARQGGEVGATNGGDLGGAVVSVRLPSAP